MSGEGGWIVWIEMEHCAGSKTTKSASIGDRRQRGRDRNRGKEGYEKVLGSMCQLFDDK